MTRYDSEGRPPPPRISYPAELEHARKMLARVAQSAQVDLVRPMHRGYAFARIEQHIRTHLARWHIDTRTTYCAEPVKFPAGVVGIRLRVDWAPFGDFAGGYIVAEARAFKGTVHHTWYPEFAKEGLDLGSPKLPKWDADMSHESFADRMRLKRLGTSQ